MTLSVAIAINGAAASCIVPRVIVEKMAFTCSLG